MQLARRLPRGRRRQGSREPQADRPQGLGAAVRRRNAQRAAIAEARSPDRRRRDRARRPGGRVQADLGVRQPGEVQPDQHRHLPGADGQGLSEGRRPFRAAQYPREPAGQLPERGADLRDLSERRRSGSTTSATSSGRRRWRASFRRRRRRAGSTRGPIGRGCCTPPTSMSTRTASATRPTSTPASISSNTKAEAPPGARLSATRRASAQANRGGDRDGHDRRSSAEPCPQHAPDRPYRSERPRRRSADHGAGRPRLYRPCLLARLQRRRRARPDAGRRR